VHVAAKESSYLSPAESTAVYDNSVRKQKHHHWRSKTARQAVVPDQLSESTSGLQGTTASSWTVSGTSQWQYPTDVIVSSASDLLHLQQFLVGKVRCIVAVEM